MSERGLKRRIADLLAERDHIAELLAAYDVVIADMRKQEADPLIGFHVVEHCRANAAVRFEHLDVTATEMAATLRVPKHSFSGRHLHMRGPRP